MQFKTPKIAVFRNQYDHYTVFMNNDCYEMDDNPLPNGINMYLGDDIEQPENDDDYVPFDQYSKGLTRNILTRIEEYRKG